MNTQFTERGERNLKLGIHHWHQRCQWLCLCLGSSTLPVKVWVDGSFFMPCQAKISYFNCKNPCIKSVQ